MCGMLQGLVITELNPLVAENHLANNRTCQIV